MKNLYLGLIMLMTFLACGSESTPPELLIDEETYQLMFMEFAIINQLDQSILEKRSEEEFRQMVYEQYGVTEEQFRISHEYYEQQIDQQLERVSEMSEILRAERDTLVVIERKYNRVTSPAQLDSLRQSLRNDQ